MFGVSLSEGGVANILARAGERAAASVVAIEREVLSSPVIKSDETSVRVGGRNWWHWVFIGTTAVSHRIVPRRNTQIIAAMMGESSADVWVSDCFGAQLNAPAKRFQLCLAHQLRDLQKVLDEIPGEPWAQGMQALFREAIHLQHRAHSAMTPRGYLRRTTQLENKLDRWLGQQLSLPSALKLQHRYQKHRNKLLTFLYRSDVPPTNNESERALRPCVIHRKVTNGFRSQWGAKAYADLLSVIATAKLKGQRAFDSLLHLMKTPALYSTNPLGP